MWLPGRGFRSATCSRRRRRSRPRPYARSCRWSRSTVALGRGPAADAAGASQPGLNAASSQLRSTVDEKPVRLEEWRSRTEARARTRRGRAPFATRTASPTSLRDASRTSPRRRVLACRSCAAPSRSQAFAFTMVRRALPRARFPFERPAVLGSIAATTVAARALRRSSLPGARELVAVGGVRPGPSVASGTRPRRIPRCRAHLDRYVRERRHSAPKEHPRVDRSSLRRWSSRPSPRTSSHPEHQRGLEGSRVLGLVAAVGGSVELLLGARNPENRAARALARPDSSSSGLPRRSRRKRSSRSRTLPATPCLALEQPLPDPAPSRCRCVDAP